MDEWYLVDALMIVNSPISPLAASDSCVSGEVEEGRIERSRQHDGGNEVMDKEFVG